jgi:hypothetical protein
MIQYDEYMQQVAYVEKLGFSSSSPKYIRQEYLDNKFFIIFRTCHSFGDWVILSALPKLLKTKYPDCTVAIPSPKCLSNYSSGDGWKHKFDNPLNNVIEVFANNPYVDGMIDEIPQNMPIFHDHFRIYDIDNPNIPLVEQILKFWKFSDDEMIDSQPDLYWSEEEKNEGDALIEKYLGNKDYGFLYIDDLAYIQDVNDIREPLELKYKIIQQEIDKHPDLDWVYFYGDNIANSPYKVNTLCVDVRDLNTTLRIQNYIKSKSKLLIGLQGGYGTDCMSRYTNCYVVPNVYNQINEHIGRKTTYLSCYEHLPNIQI